MSRRRRRSLLVPEARQALDQLKDQVMVERRWDAAPGIGSGAMPSTQPMGGPTVEGVAQSLNIPYNPRDNGDMTTRQAGRLGGEIGGSMVKRLIDIAEQQLAQQRRPR